jgi:hypothetical protein
VLVSTASTASFGFAGLDLFLRSEKGDPSLARGRSHRHDTCHALQICNRSQPTATVLACFVVTEPCGMRRGASDAAAGAGDQATFAAKRPLPLVAFALSVTAIRARYLAYLRASRRCVPEGSWTFPEK